MSFASKLKTYRKTLDCADKDIAAACGLLPSTFSRYLNGERKPESGSLIVADLADGLASMSRKLRPHDPLQANVIAAALEAELAEPSMVGMDFNMRLDALMHLIGAHNADFAEVAGVDPSYISRIRRGQRTPADIHAFANMCSHPAANLCIKRNLIDEVGELVDMPTMGREFPPSDANRESEIAEIIEVWLTGSQIVASDIGEIHRVFEWIDSTDFSEWITFGDNAINAEPEEQVPVARFYYGLGGMHKAEHQFVETAVQAHARNLVLSSDVPLPQLKVDHSSISAYMRHLENFLRNGGHIDIIHTLERPLEDTIKSLRLWIPLYLTGRVTPSYLKGVNNRLFCHVNRVCDVCALSGEAVMGHQEHGRYYFSTRPEDVSYYQRKMALVLEKASTLFEIYRECDPGQKELFYEAESARQAKGTGRIIGADKYKNLRVVSYPGDCTVISIPSGEQYVHLVVRHPKMNYVIVRMK